MKIILKEQVENYRFTVAKIVFLLSETQYAFVSDIKESNLMLVENQVSGERVYISILSKPTKIPSDEYPIHIYYQKPRYGKYKKVNEDESVENINKENRVMLLPKGFDDMFSEAIEKSFLDTESFLNTLQEELRSILDYYFLDEESELYKTLNIVKLYKYFSKKSVDENKYHINDGALSFSHPKYFNDPFDCNCSLANNQDMSDRFRVLCLTHEYDNILMWSYYSENHTGYCFEYLFSNIVSAINNLNNTISGLCIYGDLDYKNKRPKQKSQVNTFSFSDLKFYIDASFTKYDEWKHERESRFVILSDSLKEDFVQLDLDIHRIYEGCLGDGKAIFNSSGKPLKAKLLLKDDVEYLIR